MPPTCQLWINPVALAAWPAIGLQTRPMDRNAARKTPERPTAAGRARALSGQDTEKVQHLVRVLGCSEEVRVAGTRDQRIAEIAGRQRGRVAGWQLQAVGITADAVDSRVRNGRLFRVYRGVFIVGHCGPVELGDETSALLAAGEGCALTGISGSIVWDILGPECADGVIHLASRRDHRLTHHGIRVHQTRILTPEDVRVRRGLPILSAARTLLDLAEQVTLRQTELALDRALVARLLTRADVLRMTSRAASRHGAKVLNGLLGGRAPTVTRSEAEECVLALIREADLPVPLLNVRVHGFEVDFYWPEHRLVLEVDGFRYHSSRRAFEHDRLKDATLQAAGVATTRVTWRQITGARLPVVARLAQALANTRSLPGRPSP